MPDAAARVSPGGRRGRWRSRRDVPDPGPVAQQDRLLQLADCDDDVRWSYQTTGNLAHVRPGLLNIESDGVREEPIGTVESAISGLTWVGTHSKYGFGAFRVKPATLAATDLNTQIETPESEH